MWWIWIIIVMICIVLWFCIDFYIGRKKFDKQAEAREYPVRQGDLELMASGPSLFQKLFSDIEKARSSIHILFYIVQDDHLGKKFFQLLIKKANEGTEVRLILDRLGSHKITKKMVKELHDQGVQLYFSKKPSFPLIFFSIQQRNHRKITVIDGKIAYLGGFNVGKEYINEDLKLAPWRDYHLRISGEGVRDLQSEFLIDWQRSAKEKLFNQSRYFPALEKGSMDHRLFPTEGIEVEDVFARFIRESKSRIIIGSPYFIPTERVMKELVHALKRGVSLTIVVPNNSDHILVKEGSFKYFRILLSHGANIYQFQDGFYHGKVFMIDDHLCDIGTANFDQRSFFLNLECNLLIYDKPFIQTILKQINKDISQADLLKKEDLDSVGLLTRMKEGIASTISILL
jgi:cardiolipin synthase A/B